MRRSNSTSLRFCSDFGKRPFDGSKKKNRNKYKNTSFPLECPSTIGALYHPPSRLHSRCETGVPISSTHARIHHRRAARETIVCTRQRQRTHRSRRLPSLTSGQNRIPGNIKLGQTTSHRPCMDSIECRRSSVHGGLVTYLLPGADVESIETAYCGSWGRDWRTSRGW